MRRDLVAGIVALLRDRLGLAGDHGEALAGHDDVGRVGRAGDLAIVGLGSAGVRAWRD